MNAISTPNWIDDVLSFWFVELTTADWWRKSDALDADIRTRFSALHGTLNEAFPPQVDTDPRAALAAVIILDQFSRNMFRGTPAAFASDARALALADRSIGRGFDAAVEPAQRAFFYLPFEHSEVTDNQVRSVALFQALGEPQLLDYAIRHKVVIDRFGRFPHRNAILGRPSTPEELAYLAEPGSGF